MNRAVPRCVSKAYRIFEKRKPKTRHTPTGKLVAKIKKDRKLCNRIIELLSYEQEIYDYALKIHLDHCKRAGI